MTRFDPTGLAVINQVIPPPQQIFVCAKSGSDQTRPAQIRPGPLVYPTRAQLLYRTGMFFWGRSPYVVLEYCTGMLDRAGLKPGPAGGRPKPSSMQSPQPKNIKTTNLPHPISTKP